MCQAKVFSVLSHCGRKSCRNRLSHLSLGYALVKIIATCYCSFKKYFETYLLFVSVIFKGLLGLFSTIGFKLSWGSASLML